MRLTNCVINAAGAAALALLASTVLGCGRQGVVAGLLYAIHPTALHSTYAGLSEPLFIFLGMVGVGLLLHAELRPMLLGGVVLGGCTLVRANFVLWLPVTALLAVAALAWRQQRVCPKLPRGAILAGVLFCLPSLMWTGRNFDLSGKFPVISTLRGEVFYGGNNVLVANDLEYWGYWVFPDKVPGETRMGELARRYSEFDLDRYYMGKGLAFIRGNWSKMPRLWLGKLVRAYVPVPWKPNWASYGVSAFRWALYAAVFLGIWRLWGRLSRRYRFVVAGMALCNVATVLIFWGCARFVFEVEPFLIPIAVAACWFDRRDGPVKLTRMSRSQDEGART